MKIVKKSKNCGRSLYLNVRKFKLSKKKKFVVSYLVGNFRERTAEVTASEPQKLPRNSQKLPRNSQKLPQKLPHKLRRVGRDSWILPRFLGPF